VECDEIPEGKHWTKLSLAHNGPLVINFGYQYSVSAMDGL